MNRNVNDAMHDEIRTRIRLAGLAGVSYGLIAGMLWLPFGFTLADFSDLWIFYHDLERGLLPFINLADPRPLMVLPTHLAYALTPGSFVGVNVLMYALIVGKAWMAYAFVRVLLPRLPALAFFIGAVYLAFPVDTGVFWRVTVNIHAFTLAALTAATAFAILVRTTSRAAQIGLVGIMLAGQVLAFSYEAMFLPLFLVPLIVLPVLRPRRMPALLAGWYALPVILTLRYLLVIGAGATSGYQAGLFAFDAPAMASSLVRMTERHLITGWIDGIERTRPALDPGWIGLAGLGGAIGLVTGLLHLRHEAPPTRRVLAGVLIVGLVVMIAGVVAVLPTTLRDIDYRVYFASALGGAAVVVVAGYALAGLGRTPRRIGFLVAISGVFALASRLPILAAVGGAWTLLLPRRLLLAGGLAGIIAVGVLILIGQQGRYVAFSQAQGWVIGQMAAGAPAPAPDAVIVLLDDDQRRGGAIFEWQSRVLTAALAYLYEQPGLQAVICVPGTPPHGFYDETCAWTTDGLAVTAADESTVLPANRLIVFRYDDAAGALVLSTLDGVADPVPAGYAPSQVAGTGSPPARISGLFGDLPRRPAGWPSFAQLR